MFGFSLGRIFIYIIIIAAAVGYFKYTQDKLAELNQQVAQKDFALQVSNETIKKQQADMEKQGKLLQEANDNFQAARSAVTDLQDKFNREGRDFGTFVNATPGKAEQVINNASRRSWRCIESTVNKEKHDGNC